jgi:hypothetical protein
MVFSNRFKEADIEAVASIYATSLLLLLLSATSQQQSNWRKSKSNIYSHSLASTQTFQTYQPGCELGCTPCFMSGISI